LALPRLDTITCAQRRRASSARPSASSAWAFICAAGRAVIFSESLFVASECRLGVRERFECIAFGHEQPREIVSHAMRVWMLWTEYLLVDCQRALVERGRTHEITLGLKQAGGAVETYGPYGQKIRDRYRNGG
jgi:hypothetical protein